MVDLVYSVTSQADLKSVATVMGFVKANKIIRSGQLASKIGSYEFNHVGKVLIPTGNMVDGLMGPQPEMQELPGEWGRLRINGVSDFLTRIPKNAPITIYRQFGGSKAGAPIFWSIDGVTPAPSYIANIGVIL